MKKVIAFLLVICITVLSFSSLVFADDGLITPFSDLPKKEDVTK